MDGKRDTGRCWHERRGDGMVEEWTEGNESWSREKYKRKRGENSIDKKEKGCSM